MWLDLWKPVRLIAHDSRFHLATPWTEWCMNIINYQILHSKQATLVSFSVAQWLYVQEAVGMTVWKLTALNLELELRNLETLNPHNSVKLMITPLSPSLPIIILSACTWCNGSFLGKMPWCHKYVMQGQEPRSCGWKQETTMPNSLTSYILRTEWKFLCLDSTHRALNHGSPHL